MAEGLDTLSALIDACEEHGEVNHTHLEAAKAVISAEGPLDRVELAIKFLEKEIEAFRYSKYIEEITFEQLKKISV